MHPLIVLGLGSLAWWLLFGSKSAGGGATAPPPTSTPPGPPIPIPFPPEPLPTDEEDEPPADFFRTECAEWEAKLRAANDILANATPGSAAFMEASAASGQAITELANRGCVVPDRPAPVNRRQAICDAARADLAENNAILATAIPGSPEFMVAMSRVNAAITTLGQNGCG